MEASVFPVSFRERFQNLLPAIDRALQATVLPHLPENLRQPIEYFLSLPGKKIRPLLTLSACEVVRGEWAPALPAAIAVELFHDFTLIHDDIMDQDALRRGYPSLHVKYGDSLAILVGDALIGLAYQQLMKVPAPALEPATRIFTEALVKVCEGQALDKAFESRQTVSVEEYLDMIGKKTAWLFRAACALGGICGGGNEKTVHRLAEFGFHLGLAFQIQDDLLDVIADPRQLGKEVGSDFRMDKKTYVTLKYQAVLAERPEATRTYPAQAADYPHFDAFRQALQELGVVEAVQADADFYLRRTQELLSTVAPLEEANPLSAITRFLEHRQY
ncbi:MAG: polyprenyl synthetase family protein [Calditrichaeota bacterium]|nr:MAG: polyprenyl synthetase family protein [Calditrichota bacterium]